METAYTPLLKMSVLTSRQSRQSEDEDDIWVLTNAPPLTPPLAPPLAQAPSQQAHSLSTPTQPPTRRSNRLAGRDRVR